MRERENDSVSVLGAKGDTNVTCLRAFGPSQPSGDWSAEHGTGALSTKQ